jgi:hypothetical protein
MKALGDLDHGTGVLPRLGEPEPHALGGTRADRAGKGGPRHAHDRPAVLTVEAHCHSLRPEAGWTNASKSSQRKRCGTRATGR